MPSLHLLGRKWRIASDDLPFPCILGSSWHAVMAVVISLALATTVTQIGSACNYRAKHIGYLSTHLGLFIVQAIAHLWCLRESLRGSLFEVHKRTRVGPLLLCCIVMYLLIIGNNGWGTYLAGQMWTDMYPACPPIDSRLDIQQRKLFGIIVLLTWVALCVGFLACLITWNSFGRAPKRTEDTWAHCLWQNFCYCWPTKGASTSTVAVRSREAPPGKGSDEQGGKEHAARADDVHQHESATVAIAILFRYLFGGVDMTTTDFVATFLLVGTRHRFTKPALVYGTAPPPAWYGSSRSRSSGGGGGGGGNGHVTPPAGGGRDDAAPPLRPPAVLDIAADSRAVDSALINVAVGASAPPGAAAAAPTASLLDGPPADAPRAASDGQAACGAEPFCYTALTPATRGVFGTSTLPGGDIPALIDPRREWNGVVAKANASVEVLEEALHYMKFATAVYGWKMYVFMHRRHALSYCDLCLGRRCGCAKQTTYFCPCIGPDTGPAEGCCSAVKLLEREAITQVTGIADSDILYVCYENLVGGLLPYYIAADREHQSVVLAIRGSLSLQDFATDLLAVPSEYDIPGIDPKDASGQRVLWAHRGMLESAKAILNDIEAQGVLEAALAPWPTNEGGQAQLLQRLPSQRARSVAKRVQGAFAGWRVVITGHSLGGGVTGLLGPLMRERYPNLRCWAHAPPGGLMSPKAAEYTRDICISVVHAKDIVPRLSLVAMEQLLQELLTAGAHCKVTKAYIMRRMLLMGVRPGQERLFRTEEEMTSDQRDTVGGFLEHLKESTVAPKLEPAREFLPPGHVLYIERHRKVLPPEPCCSWGSSSGIDRHPDYVCRWVPAEHVASTGIIVSGSVLADHMPDNTIKALKLAFKQASEAASGAHKGAPSVQPPPQSQSPHAREEV